MKLQLDGRDRAILGLPPLCARPPEEVEPTSCEDCGDALGAEGSGGGRCGSCNRRARARYYAGVFAAAARPGLVVDERLTDAFARFLPAALARKGLLIERRGVEWVVRSAS